MMEQIPVIATAADLPNAIEAVKDNLSARWYIMRRAMQLGADEAIPSEWLIGVVASFTGDRDEEAAKGNALPDGSFPIPDKDHLRRAIHAYGRASDKARAKAHIKKRAKALGAESMLPDDWKDSAMAASAALEDEVDEQLVTHEEALHAAAYAITGYSIGEHGLEFAAFGLNDAALVASVTGTVDELEEAVIQQINALRASGNCDDDELDELIEALTAAVRHVRTEEGSRFYGQPIGAVIIKDVYIPSGKIGIGTLGKGDFFRFGNKNVQVQDISHGNGTSKVTLKDVDDFDAPATSWDLISSKQVETLRRVRADAKASLGEKPSLKDRLLGRKKDTPDPTNRLVEGTNAQLGHPPAPAPAAPAAPQRMNLAERLVEARRRDAATTEHYVQMYRRGGIDRAELEKQIGKDRADAEIAKLTAAHPDKTDDPNAKGPGASVKRTPMSREAAHAVVQSPTVDPNSKNFKEAQKVLAKPVNHTDPSKNDYVVPPWASDKPHSYQVGGTTPTRVSPAAAAGTHGEPSAPNPPARPEPHEAAGTHGPGASRSLQRGETVNLNETVRQQEAERARANAPTTRPLSELTREELRTELRKREPGSVARRQVVEEQMRRATELGKQPARDPRTMTPNEIAQQAADAAQLDVERSKIAANVALASKPTVAKPAFITGKHTSLGTVNKSASRGHPDHTVPKETLADGHVPAAGDGVVTSDGKQGTIKKTYQLYSEVQFADGSKKVVRNTKLNTTDDIREPSTSPKSRAKAAAVGNAMPNGSFPINNETELKKAIRAAGRASDPAAARAHIMRRAAALGKSDLVPASWTQTDLGQTGGHSSRDVAALSGATASQVRAALRMEHPNWQPKQVATVAAKMLDVAARKRARGGN